MEQQTESKKFLIQAAWKEVSEVYTFLETCWAAAIKLVIQPLVFLPVAAYMGFSGEKIIAILIMLASPTTPSCYIMAKSMKNDGVLTASVIVATTLFAAFTLTFWIFLLRTFGLI